MRSGAFQLSLEVSRKGLKNPIFKTSLISVGVSVVNILIHRIDSIAIGTTAASSLAALCTVGSAIIANRAPSVLPLRRLYVFRATVALCGHVGLISTLFALHDLLRTFDPRFAVTEKTALTAIAIATGCAFLIFLLIIRPRAQRFAQRIAAFASEHDATSISYLDEMYVPSSKRAATVAKSTTNAAAIFGMAVLTELPIFALVTMALELFLIMQLLYSLLSLAYEFLEVLHSGDKVKSLVVRIA